MAWQCISATIPFKGYLTVFMYVRVEDNKFQKRIIIYYAAASNLMRMLSSTSFPVYDTFRIYFDKSRRATCSRDIAR